MKLEINIDTVAESLDVDWKVACEFSAEEDLKMTEHCFRAIEAQLDGMWSLMLRAGNTCEDTKELREDIKFLREVAYYRATYFK
jgi:hypothetical protein